jgi:hypothetical protein
MAKVSCQLFFAADGQQYLFGSMIKGDLVSRVRVMIRSFQLEDADYIIYSHYEIYNREYQYDISFKEFIEVNE